MKDQLVSFETARLAKGKKFNIDNGLSYSVSGKVLKTIDTVDFIDTPRENLYKCSAPTQSLLQKWLREKHNIDITVALVGAGYGYYIHKSRKYTNKGESYGVSGNTYEETLEAGLQEALKLIRT